jgi:hypothetical protein
MSEYLDFYLGKKNRNGISIDDVFTFNYEQLEEGHDFIQFMFPLFEPSSCNFDLPELTEEDIQAFKNDTKLQIKMIRAFLKMLIFYGLRPSGDNDNPIIIKSDNYEERKDNWQTGENHNFLRITRILTSLKIFGLESISKAFYDCLMKLVEENPEGFNELSIQYWKEVVGEI